MGDTKTGFNARYFGKPYADGKQAGHRAARLAAEQGGTSTTGESPGPPRIHTQDPDITLWCGDALETLAAMPADSVDCVITSPPYWGLRDYGTGSWEGGDPDCDHRASSESRTENAKAVSGLQGSTDTIHMSIQFRDVCGKCGATRTDQQHGLEPTPDAYVERMVELFREVRRVLAKHGTCWCNLGDSYNSPPSGRNRTDYDTTPLNPDEAVRKYEAGHGFRKDKGLKPKDLVGIPWRLAFALQQDGWYLRADIIWSKPNPMPESVTDRPTKAHEYVFLLTKSPRYWFDQEAVREPAEWARWGDQTNGKHEGSGSAAGWIGEQTKADLQKRRTPTWDERKAAGATRGNLAFGDNVGAGTQRGVHGEGLSHDLGDPARGRNVRSVWEIATQPFPQAHFATFPEELVRRCLLAGCPEWVCRVCGRPRERIVEASGGTIGKSWHSHEQDPVRGSRGGEVGNRGAANGWESGDYKKSTVGWSDCGHHNYRPGLVLDPFVGSGTVPHVARKHGRHSIGIDLNQAYLDMAAERTRQLSLLATEGVQ